MVTLHTKEEKQAALLKLPKSVQDIIRNDNTGEKVRSIAGTYKLRVDQIAALEEQVVDVMLGLEKPESFIPNLKEELKLDDETISNLTKEVEEKIFKEIRSELVKFTETPATPADNADAATTVGEGAEKTAPTIKTSTPADETENETYEAYVKRRKEQLRAFGDEEGLKEFERFLTGSIIDSRMPEIRAAAKAKVDAQFRRQAAPLSSRLPSRSNIIDLRSERRMAEEESEGPRERTPRAAYNDDALDKAFVRPEPTGPVKLRPTDGVAAPKNQTPAANTASSAQTANASAPQDHPEEFISFPYKEEQGVHHDVDVDLDAIESKPISFVNKPDYTPVQERAEEMRAAPIVATPSKPTEVITPAIEPTPEPVTIIEPEVEIPPIPAAAKSTPPTAAPAIAPTPSLQEETESILSRNRGGGISKSTTVDLGSETFISDSATSRATTPEKKIDPYREPVE